MSLQKFLLTSLVKKTMIKSNLQGEQLYMTECFWYLVKSDLSSVRVYISLEWTSHFLRGTRKTRGHVYLVGLYVFHLFNNSTQKKSLKVYSCVLRYWEFALKSFYSHYVFLTSLCWFYDLVGQYVCMSRLGCYFHLWHNNKIYSSKHIEMSCLKIIYWL